MRETKALPNKYENRIRSSNNLKEKEKKFLSELMMKNLFIVHAKKSALSVGGLARTFARTCNFRCVYIMRQHLFSKENEEQIPSDKKKKKKNFVNV